MTIRRIFFILLIHFAVMVSYPYYGPGGFSFGLMSAGVWSVGAIVLGIIITLLGMERWDRLNTAVTIALLVLCAWFLLMKLPQEDKVSPMQKIAYGNLPKSEQIKDGLKPFGFNWDAIKGWVLGARGGARQLNDLEGRVDRGLKEASGE
ncbi:MAG: hypothetical protein LBI01_04555 [Elusimicrobium sp.]|jgi:hypothetical protein|nr:hypothetical protein [Elusimicrobium sp.]